MVVLIKRDQSTFLSVFNVNNLFSDFQYWSTPSICVVGACSEIYLSRRIKGILCEIEANMKLGCPEACMLAEAVGRGQHVGQGTTYSVYCHYYYDAIL